MSVLFTGEFIVRRPKRLLISRDSKYSFFGRIRWLLIKRNVVFIIKSLSLLPYVVKNNKFSCFNIKKNMWLFRSVSLRAFLKRKKSLRGREPEATWDCLTLCCALVVLCLLLNFGQFLFKNGVSSYYSIVYDILYCTLMSTNNHLCVISLFS